jgi:3-methylcrotonyl-CoA carboxylase alpha subunit
MFNKVIVANRGAVAARVLRALKSLGIRTVAVYSEADAGLPYLAMADETHAIGAADPRASYLNADVLLEVMRRSGADGLHPGYGFLSENAAFAERVNASGAGFIGPSPRWIDAMGHKTRARELMATHGMPMGASSALLDEDDARTLAHAQGVGYPVLVKPAGGGGGIGMLPARDDAELLKAVTQARSMAQRSFGNAELYLERLVERPRHVEFQVLADRHGNVRHLFERDCSVQRRHQKVLEEAPAPGMTSERRARMGAAAVAAARAVDYSGAGTVEFIVGADGEFYFMEMNTRLQVEHPVTEMITGLDLVEWQLRVAAGGRLPLEQAALAIRGHAIEARIYAEDPARDFLPSIGTLAYLGLPPHTAFANGDIRVDGGVRMGDTITPFYDPMIAKLIVHGADRDQARARMLQALAQTQAVGVQTNVAFLSRLMKDSAFAAADLDTGLIERQRSTLLPDPQPADADALALATAAVLVRQGLAQPGAQGAGKGPTDPWDARDGWRLGGQYRRQLQWTDNGEARHVIVARQGGAWTLDTGDGARPFLWRSHASANPNLAYGLRITLQGHESAGTVVLHGDRAYVFREDGSHVLELYDALTHSQDTQGEHGAGLAAPMPGKIISISVKAGDKVEKGQPLLVMEAMKMEHTISATADGTVGEVFYGVGDQVTEGAELVSIE